MNDENPNPFVSNTKGDSPAAMPLEAISRAEIDMAIATARRYPRDVVAVKKEMLALATLDQDTAEACFYSLPRGGKNIEGPSVRLAEIAVSCYGNLRAGSRILEVVPQGDNPYVVVQSVCTDLQKNITVSIEKRRRITKKRSKMTVDEDDINLAVNACSAIAFRDAVFKVVPLALIKPVYEQARKVAIGDAKTLVARRERAIAVLLKMGVKLEQILERLGKKAVEAIDIDDLETLFGLRNAIKEGELTIEQAFAPEQPVNTAKKPEISGPRTSAKTVPQRGSEPAGADTSVAADSKPSLPQGNTAAPESSTETEAPNPDDGDLAPVTSEPAQAFAKNPNESDELNEVRYLMFKSGVSEEQVMAWCRKNSMAKDGQKLSDLSTAKHKTVISAWNNRLGEIKRA